MTEVETIVESVTSSDGADKVLFFFDFFFARFSAEVWGDGAEGPATEGNVTALIPFPVFCTFFEPEDEPKMRSISDIDFERLSRVIDARREHRCAEKQARTKWKRNRRKREMSRERSSLELEELVSHSPFVHRRLARHHCPPIFSPRVVL